LDPADTKKLEDCRPKVTAVVVRITQSFCATEEQLDAVNQGRRPGVHLHIVLEHV
jgi:hypothetical protein